MLNEVFEVNFLLSNILIPLGVLIFYFASIELLLAPLFDLQEGVNLIFARRSWTFFSVLALGSSLIFIAIYMLKPNVRLSLKKSTDKISRGDLILLLLPLTPVMQYVINNLDILSTWGSLFAIVFFLIFSSVYIFLIPAIFGFVASTRILMYLGVAFTFTITSMALLSSSYAWYEKGSLKIQFLFFGGTFLLTWLLYRLNKTVLHIVIVVVFLSNSVMQVLAQDGLTTRKPIPDTENQLVALVGDDEPAVTPNIYLLIYDSYVANETMLAYGIDNSSQEDYLREMGFVLYPHTYSVSNISLGTMSRVLNASRENPGDPRMAVAGDGIVLNSLKSFGYQTYGLFPNDLFFRKYDPTYDYSIPEFSKISQDILIRAILMGEFRFDIGFDLQSREEFVKTKRTVFESKPGNPIVVYMHSSLPGHSQNSGGCRSDETERFTARLTSANAEMKEDIDRIVQNDPAAIIIVAGDHGPYLTKNCASLSAYDESEISRLDIQDRFGTFLAIRWPTGEFEQFDDIVVLQDLFPVVFANMFNDERFLEAKIRSATISPNAKVREGIISRGINRDEPLFEVDK